MYLRYGNVTKSILFKVLLEKATLKKRPPYFSMVIGKCPGASGGSDSEPKPRLELFL